MLSAAVVTDTPPTRTRSYRYTQTYAITMVSPRQLRLMTRNKSGAEGRCTVPAGGGHCVSKDCYPTLTAGLAPQQALLQLSTVDNFSAASHHQQPWPDGHIADSRCISMLDLTCSSTCNDCYVNPNKQLSCHPTDHVVLTTLC